VLLHPRSLRKFSGNCEDTLNRAHCPRLRKKELNVPIRMFSVR
jgi:hypothetical protein